jgi:hypothetical protein
MQAFRRGQGRTAAAGSQQSADALAEEMTSTRAAAPEHPEQRPVIIRMFMFIIIII